MPYVDNSVITYKVTYTFAGYTEWEIMYGKDEEDVRLKMSFTRAFDEIISIEERYNE